VAGQDTIACHQRQAVSTRIQPAVGNRDDFRFAVEAEDVGSVATLDLPVPQRPTTLNFCPAVLLLFVTSTILAKKKLPSREKGKYFFLSNYPKGHKSRRQLCFLVEGYHFLRVMNYPPGGRLLQQIAIAERMKILIPGKPPHEFLRIKLRNVLQIRHG
jgi:hypothetical protein